MTTRDMLEELLTKEVDFKGVMVIDTKPFERWIDDLDNDIKDREDLLATRDYTKEQKAKIKKRIAIFKEEKDSVASYMRIAAQTNIDKIITINGKYKIRSR